MHSFIFLLSFELKQAIMLKWTVHKRTEPTSNVGLVLGQSDHEQLNSRRSLGNLSRPLRHRDNRSECRRKSLGSSELSKRIHNRDKENRHVQTPHPYSYRGNVTSTPQSFGKMDYALRDVRNLTPKNSNSSTMVTPSRKRPLAKTPPSSPIARPAIVSTPTPYATTLPTFDVEYSPCGVAATATTTKTTRSMAPPTLNSITVTDSYFNQPRYFQEPLPASKRLKFSPSGMTPLSTRLSELRFSKISFKRGQSMVNKSKEMTASTTVMAKCMAPPSSTVVVDESLSSSALNDTALDKMIDAILESARKERPSNVRNLAVRKVHLAIGSNGGGGGHTIQTESPTYTAAEDPASDLNKYCDNFLISPDKLLAAGERTIILEETNLVNEREVKTPEVLDTKYAKTEQKPPTIEAATENSCHLRRQRAVRRKHQQKCDQIVTSAAAESNSTTPIATTPILDAEGSHCVSKWFSSGDRQDAVLSTSLDLKKSIDELANMNTPIVDADDDADQQPHCGITSITSKISSDSTPIIHTKDLQASSTPTNGVTSIRRCLNFSDSPNATSVDDSIEKRKSTASSTVSMASTSASSYTRTTAISGSLDVAIFIENNKLNIHGESAV